MLFGLAVGGTATLGLCGFLSYSAPASSGGPTGFGVDAMFATTKLLDAGGVGGVSPEHLNAALTIARLLGPLLLFLAAFRTAKVLLSHQWRLFKLRTATGHLVISGVEGRSQTLGLSLAAEPRERQRGSSLWAQARRRCRDCSCPASSGWTGTRPILRR